MIYSIRGEIDKVGTSYRFFWKVEGEEQKSDSFGGSDGAGVRRQWVEWFCFFRLLQAGAELEHPTEKLTLSVVFDLWVWVATVGRVVKSWFLFYELLCSVSLQ